MARPVKEPERFDDPPEEDSEVEPEPKAVLQHENVDSSEGETLTSNIQRSTFTTGKVSTTANTASGQKRNARGKDKGTGTISQQAASRPTRAGKRTKVEDIDENEDDLFSSKKRAKVGSERIADKVGGHMNPEVRVLSAGKSSKNKAGYGKAAKSSQRRARDPSDSMSPAKPFRGNDRYKSLSSSPVNLKLSQQLKMEDGSSSDLTDPPSSSKSDPPRAMDHRDKKANTRKGKKSKVPELFAEPVSQMPAFKIPDAYGDYAPVGMADFDTTIDDEPVVQERQLEPGMALCPMCDEQVDEELLKEFSKGARMVMARQAKFCRIHRRMTAEKTYEDKGYPKIDWTALRSRIERHHDYLESLILGAESHFGGILTEHIRIGHARTLLTTRDYPTPGYYGLRGMSFMTEMVTETFSKLLREKAPSDTRISGRGYTGFVQSVLVQELAVKLIQEDLSLNEDKAREVMVESRELGEILNDEKRESQSRTRNGQNQKHQEEDQEHREDEESSDVENGISGESVDEGPADLKTQEVVESDYDFLSHLTHGQIDAGEQPRKIDDSGADPKLAPRRGQASKAKDSVKTQDATALPVRASPRVSRSTKTKPVPATSRADNSDDSDSSSLSSGLESI